MAEKGKSIERSEKIRQESMTVINKAIERGGGWRGREGRSEKETPQIREGKRRGGKRWEAKERKGKEGKGC